jgi:hypothetical protein
VLDTVHARAGRSVGVEGDLDIVLGLADNNPEPLLAAHCARA